MSLLFWRLGDSNSWPSACKADALPAELSPHILFSRNLLTICYRLHFLFYMLIFFCKPLSSIFPENYCHFNGKNFTISHNRSLSCSCQYPIKTSNAVACRYSVCICRRPTGIGRFLPRRASSFSSSVRCSSIKCSISAWYAAFTLSVVIACNLFALSVWRTVCSRINNSHTASPRYA